MPWPGIRLTASGKTTGTKKKWVTPYPASISAIWSLVCTCTYLLSSRATAAGCPSPPAKVEDFPERERLTASAHPDLAGHGGARASRLRSDAYVPAQLAGVPPAVDDQLVAGDVVRRPGGEEDDAA